MQEWHPYMNLPLIRLREVSKFGEQYNSVERTKVLY